VTFDPISAIAHHILAKARLDFADFGGSLPHSEAALRLEPGRQDTWLNLADAPGKAGRHENALVAYDRALANDASFADCWYNKGVTLNDLGRTEDALACSTSALPLRPDHIEAICGESPARLALASLERGWVTCESRWQGEGHNTYRDANIPPLAILHGISGRRILVWAEQGLGDGIQFSRLLSPL
jgi:tetratricopeptide (TPR) repeat protein